MSKNLLVLILSIFIISGCIPEQSVRTPVSVENSDSTNNDVTTEIDIEDTEVKTTAYWFDNGQASSSFTVDVSNLKNGYILGDDVNLFLANPTNYSEEYCMFVDFTQTFNTTTKKLMARLIPSITSNPVTGKVTYYFRAAINTASGNDACQLQYSDNPNANVPTYLTYSNPAFVASDICTNCLNIVQSESVKIYKKNTSNRLDLLPNSAFDFESLVFRVDMNSNTNNNQPSCTNAQCQSLGFNCCVSGQCVNDAQLKMSRNEIMSTYPDLLVEFDLAESLKTINTNWYFDYPQFYYICLENVPNDDDDGVLDPADPVGDATKRLNEMVIDYFCTEELQKNSLSTPFHNDPIDGSKTYNICKLSQTPGEDPSMYFRDVMTRMYKHCGCDSTTYTEMVANCPKYTYKSFYAGEILDFELQDMYDWMTTNNVSDLSTVNDLGSVTGFARIECVSPEVDPNILPFQDLDVIVSSKTAPHRFFSNSISDVNISNEITDFTELPEDTTGIQEGEEFQYLDNEKLFPLNGSFNMNSILGQMSFNLSKTQPAKKVDLEFDKLYYIATIEGYYTPCPTCSKDYWFPNFSAQPITTQGVGLQSVGYTTRRDAWGSNTTFGNYEDTVFGRACWLPPTMIPFSHKPENNSKAQRLNRLKTQAAFYSNGYQRDWFGFNKGALIGSFDGVSWFAIGKGRVVRATTSKLYLAVNAPFADLTQSNDHIVSVQEWDFVTTGARYDYDPNEDINSSLQNEAGLCQRHHSCETDSDCITQLGWEYMCADVNSQQTSWPKFDANTAQEIANDEKTGTLISFLAQGELPPGDTSRKCVYRGAGSPCRKDYTQITDSNLRKSLTCAPNFYCANLSDQTAYNKEVARYAAPLEDISETNNHYYGQEANILGRPKQYLSTGTNPLFGLPTVANNNIDKNILLNDPTSTGDMGICRPGKLLPKLETDGSISNIKPSEQHQASDNEYRTDFISQISGCNSILYDQFRTSSCPILDNEGNYINNNDDFLNNNYSINTTTFSNLTKSTTIEILANSQNSCGLESIDPNFNITAVTTMEEIRDNSTFKLIEAKSLNSSNLNFEPTLAADACFRRAGSVCHTDLDCSPNYKHADLIDLINPDFFGNEAEKKYWTEYLVCGQGPREPLIAGTEEFNEYDITQNRCCREIGRSITMYTEDSPSSLGVVNFKAHKFASMNPNASDRYSRYSIVENYLDGTNKTGTISRPTANTDADVSGNLTSTPNILTPDQWDTISETGSKSCCGGGWIRKFADGTNNWSVNRLNLDVTNFKCLSFNTPLVRTQNPAAFGLNSAQLNSDSQNLCISVVADRSSCAQQPFGKIDDFDEVKPSLNNISGADAEMVLYSDPLDMVGKWETNPWSYRELYSIDSNPDTWLDWNETYEDHKRDNISVSLPAFITWPDENVEIDDAESRILIELEMFTTADNSEYKECTRVTTDYSCSNPQTGWGGLCGPKLPDNSSSWWGPANTGLCTDECCYAYDKSSRSLKVAPNYLYTENALTGTDPGSVETNLFDYNGGNNNNFTRNPRSLRITFIAPGTLEWEKHVLKDLYPADDVTTQVNGQNIIEARRTAAAGNAMYYLNKLSKLELLGIPQVTYEPMYCNDNYQKIVPGIFDSSIKNVVDFNNHPDTFLNEGIGIFTSRPWKVDLATGVYDASSLNQPYITTQKLVDHEPIFSDNEFMCCTPLGKTLQEGEALTNCCSGYAVEDDNGGGPVKTYKCMLPPNTNLNVYFNKFVSGEGTSSDLETPLVSTDFDTKTGAPRMDTSVFKKLQQLATQFCAPSFQYVRGGAFGEFTAEPRGSLGTLDAADDDLRLFSILDSQNDEGNNTTNESGYVPFDAGLRWNNNVYCAPADSGN